MTAIAVVGSQWGDEGKGKITDFLSKDAAMAVRSMVVTMQATQLKLVTRLSRCA